MTAKRLFIEMCKSTLRLISGFGLGARGEIPGSVHNPLRNSVATIPRNMSSKPAESSIV